MTRIKNPAITARALAYLIGSSLIMLAPPAFAEKEVLGISGDLRLDCQRSRAVAHVKICNKLDQRADIEATIRQGEAEYATLTRDVELNPGSCVVYDTLISDPFSAYSVSLLARVGFLRRKRIEKQAPLLFASPYEGQAESTGALGLCFTKGKSPEGVAKLAEQEILAWRVILSSQGTTCGCLEAPVGMEADILRSLWRLDLLSSAVPVQPSSPQPGKVLVAQVIEPRTPGDDSKLKVGATPSWNVWDGQESVGSQPSASLLSVDSSMARISAGGISEGLLRSLIASFFLSHFGNKKHKVAVDILDGPLDMIIQTGWFEGEILGDQSYWERILFRVGYRVESRIIYLKINGEAWYNLLPTARGQEYMLPSSGEAELKRYIDGRLSDLAASIKNH